MQRFGFPLSRKQQAYEIESLRRMSLTPSSSKEVARVEENHEPNVHDEPVMWRYTEPYTEIAKISTFPKVEDIRKMVGLIFELASGTVALYLGYCIFWALRMDINAKVNKKTEELIQASSLCSVNYINNQCEPLHSRLPGLEQQCRQWQVCMNQDPAQTAAQSVMAAEALGKSVNSFFEELSWKTMVMLTSTSMCLIITSSNLWKRMQHVTDYQDEPRVIEEHTYRGKPLASNIRKLQHHPMTRRSIASIG